MNFPVYSPEEAGDYIAEGGWSSGSYISFDANEGDTLDYYIGDLIALSFVLQRSGHQYSSQACRLHLRQS